MITFTLPYPAGAKAKSVFCRQFSLNAYYGGKHWTQRKKDAEYIHMLTKLALRRAGISPGILDFPVEIRFFWDDGLDIDNHAAIGKMVVDALKGYLLTDDNRRWFRRVSHEFWGGGTIRVDILPFEEREERANEQA